MYSGSLECMKKFQQSLAENNSPESTYDSAYETADIRLRNQTKKQPIFAVGRVNKTKPTELKEFVKSQFEETDVGPSRFLWNGGTNSNVPAMDAIKARIKLLEYKIIHSFEVAAHPNDSKGKFSKNYLSVSLISNF